MATVVQRSRNPIVQAAFAGLRADERRERRIHKVLTKPAVEAPAPEPKKPKSPRSKGGKPSKRKS